MLTEKPFCPCICVYRYHGRSKCEFVPALNLDQGDLSSVPLGSLISKVRAQSQSNRLLFSVLTPWRRACTYGRAVLLAVCRQSGADAEGLVQQSVFQNVDDWLVHRNSLHAIRDTFHPRGSPQGTHCTVW